MKIIVFILSFFSSVALSECSNDVTVLYQGDPAPCKGFLFSPKKEEEVRKKITESDLDKTKLELQEKQLILYDKLLKLTQEQADKELEKSELWRKKAIESSEKLTDDKTRDWWRDGAFLIGGVVVTVAAGWALGAASGAVAVVPLL